MYNIGIIYNDNTYYTLLNIVKTVTEKSYYVSIIL